MKKKNVTLLAIGSAVLTALTIKLIKNKKATKQEEINNIDNEGIGEVISIDQIDRYYIKLSNEPDSETVLDFGIFDKEIAKDFDSDIEETKTKKK